MRGLNSLAIRRAFTIIPAKCFLFLGTVPWNKIFMSIFEYALGQLSMTTWDQILVGISLVEYIQTVGEYTYTFCW